MSFDRSLEIGQYRTLLQVQHLHHRQDGCGNISWQL